MANFEEKVEALRRLQEKRQLRELRSKETSKVAEADVQASIDTSTEQKSAGKDANHEDLTAVLEHYAGIQDAPEDSTAGGYVANGLPVPSSSASQPSSDEGDALYCLGHCYEQGVHDCRQDIEMAVMYYRQAAEKGSAVAQWRLGHMFEYGEGVQPDDALASRWYRQAAEAGHQHAQSSLALLLEDGRATMTHDGEALHWHRKAASQGNALSQYCIACALADGRGSEDDDLDVITLLEKSAASGFPLAAEALHEHRARGTADQHINNCEDDGSSDILIEDTETSLLELAARVAKQIKHLPDSEAEGFLDGLLSSFDDLPVLDSEDLQDIQAEDALDLVELPN